MNFNKNLHSKTVLTEFARDFEHDSNETVITKIVNKIYEACNNVNADLTSASTSSSPTYINKSNNNNPDSETISQNDQEDAATPLSQSQSSSSSTSKSDIVGVKKDGEEITVYQVDASQGRTSLNVVKRISNLITMKDKNLNEYKNTEVSFKKKPKK